MYYAAIQNIYRAPYSSSSARSFYNSQMCLHLRRANLEISYNTWRRKYARNVCVYGCIYFIPKNPCGMAVAFEAEPLRHESASDSFSLRLQRREFYILCSSLSLTLSSALGCHYICNLMLRHCFHSLLRNLPTCRKNKRRISFWKWKSG